MSKLGIRFRDVLFGAGGAAILYHEVVVVDTAEPLVVFAAFFLLGLIPATRADPGGSGVKDWMRTWLLEDQDKNKKE